jgi:hypothetical protein
MLKDERKTDTECEQKTLIIFVSVTDSFNTIS